MSPSRRQFLRRTGQAATVAGLAGVTGCTSLGQSDASTTTPSPGREPTVGWRQTFGTGNDEYGASLSAPTDDRLALITVTDRRTDGGIHVYETLVGGYDTAGDERWRYTYEPEDAEETTPDEGPTGWASEDVVAVPDGFVTGVVRLRPDRRPTSPRLVRLGTDGTERWTRELSGAGVPLLAARPPDASGEVVAYAARLASAEGGAIFTALHADGTAAWRHTFEPGRVERPTDVRVRPDGSVVLAGRPGDDAAASATVLTVSPDGRVVDDRHYEDERDLPHPQPIASSDGSLLAINTVTNSFAAGCVVVELADDGTAEWRTTFDGWHVGGIVGARPFAPGEGHVLAMGRGGENELGDAGAQLVAIRGDGGVGWTYDELQTSERWRFRSLVAGDGALFAGAEVQVGEDDGQDAAAARFSPAPSDE